MYIYIIFIYVNYIYISPINFFDHLWGEIFTHFFKFPKCRMVTSTMETDIFLEESVNE